MEKIREKILAAYEEAKSGWSDYIINCLEDNEFYLSKQWSDADLETCAKKNSPALSINHIKGNVDLISGYQRQNRSDLKVYPIEGSDALYADVYTRVIKWIMTDRNAEFIVSDAFKDALKGGIGWLNAYLDYQLDPINGDVVVKKTSPFEILPDPHFIERDLSDCDYIIRHKKLNKDKLKSLFPKYKTQIDALGGNVVNDENTQYTTVPGDMGNKILVLEYWHREWEETDFLINSQDTSDCFRWNGTPEEMEEFQKEAPNYIPVKRNIPRIKLAILVDKDLVVYDGNSPHDTDEYPFIPVFAFYDSSMAEWSLKLQGIIRPLKDLQREKNKRRSQIMQAINTMPHSGWIYEKNAVDDKAVLANSSGAGKLIEYNPGRTRPERIPPPDLPASIMQLEMMFGDDMKIVGANPDLLGLITEKGAPGIAIQLRQKQGITSIQEVLIPFPMQ